MAVLSCRSQVKIILTGVGQHEGMWRTRCPNSIPRLPEQETLCFVLYVTMRIRTQNDNAIAIIIRHALK